MGRHKLENPKSTFFYIRVRPDRKAEIFAFARANGYSLLELMEEGIKAIENKATAG